MGLGVLEPSTTTHVAGTVLLNEAAAHSLPQTGNLKHGTGRDKNVVLAPQPSDDPNDPLNWSSFEKHTIIGVLCYGAITSTTVVGPLLAAGTVEVSVDLGVSVTDIALLTGYLLLAAGASGFFVSALARKFGKRPLYLLSSLLAVVGCIIGEVAKEYSTLVGARVIQGLAMAAYESLILTSIGDLFFVHERGTRVSAVMFILTAINNGVSIIAGVITARFGWSYNFHILLPFTTLQFILVFLFVPETSYNRSKIYETDIIGSNVNLEELGDVEAAAGTPDEPTKESVGSEEIENVRTCTTLPRRKSFRQRLAVWNGVFVEDSLIKMLLSCPAILLNVAALYNVVVSGVTITWSVGTSIISAVLWSAPPYSLSPAGIGYVSTGPLIGGTLGLIVYGLIADPLIKAVARRNKGVYEPEFRLPVIVIGLIPTVAGLVGFGYACQNSVSIYLISFAWGVLMFGLFISAAVNSAYVLDAMREHSTEIFIMNMVFKNFFFYGISDYGIDWLMTQGVSSMSNVMAGISAGLILTSVPMYIYGKRYRSFWQHHNLIKRWHLETEKAGDE
ncbi:MFS general substrate transporter [Penicillium concentricum]|uniref:MFS general substrate transporter n=1 Tax=Penicillium concentricum TaxID=293559 RepID=A0A9X0B286_9EURO|nr:MFS general substrate transporter [Penicillium concentricum]KAJ5385549.1 MFS general substrate transporter [Penicillium concentricum]